MALPPVNPRVLEHCRRAPERMTWLERLPRAIEALLERWQLAIDGRFEGEGDVSWVAAVTRRDGSSAVLKLGMPHMEAEHEIDGLGFWDGDGTVRLLASDAALGAMLLERCIPGTRLRELPELEQDLVLGRLALRLWKAPPAGHPFRPLATMVEQWIRETLAQRADWSDPALVRAGIDAFRELASGGPPAVLLATDLHAGNVLRAQREPWLVIDPKPFVGDPAYDATQHLLNCEQRLCADAEGTIARVAGLMRLDSARVRRWLFARLAAEPRDDWAADRSIAIARALQ
ncbi:MAG TPA: aminoglycoside phosphotransferase family protein [Gemmatimonadales bacterium]|nr:aminoglycoside phosphotransferase family protein [Gemmatimonadales bacterium]